MLFFDQISSVLRSRTFFSLDGGVTARLVGTTDVTLWQCSGSVVRAGKKEWRSHKQSCSDGSLFCTEALHRNLIQEFVQEPGARNLSRNLVQETYTGILYRKLFRNLPPEPRPGTLFIQGLVQKHWAGKRFLKPFVRQVLPCTGRKEWGSFVRKAGVRSA